MDDTIGDLIPIKEFGITLPELTRLTHDDRLLTLDQYFKYLEKRILQADYVVSIMALPMASASQTPLTSAEEMQFDATFKIGPGGAINLLNLLSTAYSGTERIPADAFVATKNDQIFTQLCEVSLSLRVCLDHFREKNPHILWDPKEGVRELREVYKLSSHKLPVRFPWFLLTMF